MKIVLITRDRPELTRQTIETMVNNSADFTRHNLVVVFDGTEAEADKLFPPGSTDQGEIITGKQVGVGAAKNLGAGYQGRYMLPDDVLMFSDNDMYYLKNWDKRLEDALNNSNAVQLGGWKHPYHKAITTRPQDGETFLEVDAITGNCFVIRYKDWLKYGPFDSNAVGVGQSEDYALSQRIIKTGNWVATLDPPVAIHVGLRNSEGNPATGWEQMAQMAEKQIIENNIKEIWIDTPDEGTILLEPNSSRFSGINVGSGQRRFDNAKGWINVDCVSRPPDQVPDVVCDANKLTEKFEENSQDMVVLHHVLEHFGCGEADEILRQCYKTLKPGGSLLIFVPSMRALAGRWLSGELDTFLFMANTYGAYQGEEGDRHKWGYSCNSLKQYVMDTLRLQDTQYKKFDWRQIPGADIAKDWWILGVEVVK